MGLKRWQLAEADKTLCETLAAEAGIHPFLARLLVVRGVTDAEEAEAFLYGRELTDDPFAFADMDAAVDRITEAIENREKILVFGDYDADGVTATVRRSLGGDIDASCGQLRRKAMEEEKRA